LESVRQEASKRLAMLHELALEDLGD
jgi:hypothetical protein